MNKLLIVLLLIIPVYSLSAQNLSNVTIHVLSKDGSPVSSSHLTLNDTEHFISDENGIITLSTNSNSLNIQVTHIGFSSLDTLLNIDAKTVHKLILRPVSYSIDPVTISEKLRLFEKQNWSIKDITHHEFGFLVSAIEKSKRYIYLFDKNGVQILKSRTKFKHNTIANGLKPGHYHLMSERNGKEIMVSTDTIIFLNTATIEQYDKTLHLFNYMNSNYTVAEEWALHNKMFTISRLDNKTFVREPFHKAFDEESFIRSQSVYRELIGLYFKATNTNDDKAIDYEFLGEKENIIRTGEWTGDLYDLIISDTIQQVYNYYKNIYANELDISTQVKGNQLYVLDDLKRQMTIYDLEIEEIIERDHKIDLPANMIKGAFMNSGQKDILFIESDDGYFQYDINSETFSPIQFQEQTYWHPKSKFIDNNTLYVLAQKSRIKPKLSIVSCEMLNPKIETK